MIALAFFSIGAVVLVCAGLIAWSLCRAAAAVNFVYEAWDDPCPFPRHWT